MSDVVVPDHVPAELVRSFTLDFRGPIDEIFPRLDALRGEGRALWLTTGLGGPISPTGVWFFTQADDIRRALQTTELFPQAMGDVGDQQTPVMLPIALDPPEHGRYRRLLTPLFAPAVVKTMEDSIRSRIRRLVATVADRGECEFVSEVATQFPTRVFTSWIGLPEEETDRFVTLTSALIHGTLEESAAAIGAATAALDQLVRTRAAEPTDDLMSQIAIQEIDGRPLTHEELMSIAYLLFLAGLDTVAAALSFSFWHLALNPVDRRAIASGEVPAAQAVEELLRRHSFVNLPRRVAKDSTFAGVSLREGDRVVLSLPMASRDPAEFDDPTSVLLEREANRHFAFGAGPHRCVGSHLARLEMQVALQEWHARIPDYELAGETGGYAGSVMGVTVLPLKW